MKTLLLVTAALATAATVANAETFTITGGWTERGVQVGAPGPDGKPVGGGVFKIETEIVWASGVKEHSTGDCVGWSAPPASGFASQGVCNSAGGDVKTALLFWCSPTNDKPPIENDCWGRMTFMSGKNQGKSATVTWHGKLNADGKGSTDVGAGNMN